MKPCTICDKETEWCCADCRIDRKITVYVCESRECRDKHEQINCSKENKLFTRV